MYLLHRTAALLLLIVLTACGGSAGDGQAAAESSAAVAPGASPPAASTPAAASTRASGGATPAPGPGEFVNPVLDQDFPDPDVLKVGDKYYAYATNAAGKNIQTATSTDLVSWQSGADALPALPAWARSGLTWAPEVTTWDQGQSFVMYYTARDIASDKQCIGAATAAKPEGPFTGASDAPLICQVDDGGSIDASSFRDEDGSRYLLWKNDGNCCGKRTYVYLQPVSEDGLTLQGEPVQLISNDKAWEGGLVEAPTLWKHDGRYYLLYSANNYAGAQYAIGYASADGVAGPYEKPGREPLVKTVFGTGVAIGPGGQDIVLDNDGETWLMYHSWDPTITYRRINLDELAWEDGKPVLKGPDGVPQARP